MLDIDRRAEAPVVAKCNQQRSQGADEDDLQPVGAVEKPHLAGSFDSPENSRCGRVLEREQSRWVDQGFQENDMDREIQERIAGKRDEGGREH